MRNPYKPRADHTPFIVAGLAGLVVLAVVLIAVYVLRPASSPAHQRAEHALELQMDHAEALAARKERDRRAEATRGLA